MKFVILAKLTDKEKESIQNKKVCDVVEYVIQSELGPYKGWAGSVEEEYFSIAFVKGVLSVSLNEREMCVGWGITNVAMVEHLHSLLTNGKMDLASIQELVSNYNRIESNADMKQITFKDVMSVLKWKFKSRKVKVKEHFLN